MQDHSRKELELTKITIQNIEADYPNMIVSRQDQNARSGKIINRQSMAGSLQSLPIENVRGP